MKTTNAAKKLFTKHDLLLSWALAEALSPRWETAYAGRISPQAQAELAKGDFRNLSPETQVELVTLLKERRKDYLTRYIEPATRITMVKFPVDMLEHVCVSPTISWRTTPYTLGKFIQGSYDPTTWHDPRNAARRLMEAPEKTEFTGYPIFAWDPVLEADVLIEGYTRCIAALYRQRAGEQVKDIIGLRCE